MLREDAAFFEGASMSEGECTPTASGHSEASSMHLRARVSSNPFFRIPVPQTLRWLSSSTRILTLLYHLYANISITIQGLLELFTKCVYSIK